MCYFSVFSAIFLSITAPISAEAATTKVLGVNKTFTKTATKVSGLSKSEKKIVKVTVNKSKKKVTVKGLKPGKASFKIGSKSYTVKVGAVKIKKKSFATSMTAGTDKKVTVTSSYGAKDVLKWSSSDKKVVKVKLASTTATSKKVATNRLYALKTGTATITVKSKNTGKSLKVKVTVKAAETATATPAATATATTVPTATGSATTTPSVAPTATATAPTATATAPTATATGGAVETQTPSAQETLAPQETVNPTATNGAITVTANVSGASIQVLSGSSLVAAVSMDADKTSATTGVLAPGVYTIEVSKDGYDTYTGTVTVDGATTVNVELKESLKTGANASVTNALIGYENTVLVNDNAIVTVKVTDSTGAPLANKTLVVSTNKNEFRVPTSTYLTEAGVTEDKRAYEIKGDSVITTDANGQASFIVGANVQGLKADNEHYVGTVQYRASVVGSNNANDVATGVVKFASINVGTVSPVTGEDDDYKDVLVTGTEAYAAGYNDIEAAIASTMPLSGKEESKFISTQQVSKSGTTENEVSFKVTPQIILPDYAGESDDVDKFVQPLNEKSGEYGTYETQSKVIPLKVEASSLQYATLNFDNIQLSKYTKMTIACYKTKDAESESDKVLSSEVEILGEKEQSKFAYQIPLTNNDVKSIKVTLESEGQVQTDKNDGYSITNIEGVYKKAGTATDGGAQDLTTATVNWSAEEPTYSNEMPLDKAKAITVLGITPNDQTAGSADAATTKSTFKYQVPVFPNTGNAVIREYDSNKKLVAYYLAPTENNYAISNGKKVYDNTNDIAALVEYTAHTDNIAYVTNGMKAYKATEEEATHPITTGVTVKDNVVTVNSEKVGYTNLKGTISIAGIGTDQLNALNSEVFTSVHWNPTPVDEEDEVENADEFLALAGQKITVYAQLRDANNNPVSKAGEAIQYELDGAAFNGTDDVTVLSGISGTTNKTDVNGRATLELKAATATELCKLTAELQSGNDEYKVTLSIGDKNVKSADLYWIDANLSFTNRVLSNDEKAALPTIPDDYVTITTTNDSKEKDVAEIKVGTPWKFAVETVGNVIQNRSAVLYDYDITIDGLNVAMSSDSDNKGTYDFTTGNGVALATSATAQKDEITARINESSVSDNVKFTATYTDPVTSEETVKEYISVGTGTPNLNAKLTLGIDWQAEGYKLAMVTPYGTNAAYDASSKEGKTTVCVKVTDETGKNVVADKDVTFTSGNTSDVLKDTSGTGSTNTITATTNSYGIATIEVNRDASGEPTSSIIKAEVQGVADIASTTINWVEEDTAFGLVNAKVTNTAKTEIELTFNNDVYAGSVQNGQFKVTGTENGKVQTYDVTKATVNGNKVTLTLGTALPANEYTVTIGDKKVEGVTYSICDETGAALATGYETVNFYSEKIADFDVTGNNQGTSVDVVIDDIDSPVALTDLNDDSNIDNADVKKYLETYLVVTIDGVIYKYDGTNNKLTDGTNDVTVTDGGEDTLEEDSLTFNIAKDTSIHTVNVYLLGEVNSVRVAKLTDEDVANAAAAAQSALDGATITVPTVASWGNGASVTIATVDGCTATVEITTNDDGIFATTDGTSLALAADILGLTTSSTATVKVTYTNDTYSSVKRTVTYDVAITDSGSGVDGITFTAQ